jgi:hypothetical protein
VGQRHDMASDPVTPLHCRVGKGAQCRVLASMTMVRMRAVPTRSGPARLDRLRVGTALRPTVARTAIVPSAFAHPTDVPKALRLF